MDTLIAGSPDARDLAAWPLLEGSTATLINLSENATFRVKTPHGEGFILRLHRPGYHGRAAIESELAWVAALRADTGLPVPRPVRGKDREFVQDCAGRDAVLFHFEAGREPGMNDDLPDLFSTLGGYVARANTHSIGWTRPAGFVRPIWSAEAILGADGVWGDWRAAPGVAAVREVLDQLDGRLRSDLAMYGEGPQRFGLIHADMRLANLLVADGRTTLIDFDDCGDGWFVYDFAAAVSFFEHDPRIEELKGRWIEAYRRVRPLSESDAAAIDTAILLRRMALLAWIGSHGETELARSQVVGFAETTAVLAERYFRTGRVTSQ